MQFYAASKECKLCLRSRSMRQRLAKELGRSKGVPVADLDLKELLELLGQEQACYTALIDLSRQQRNAIEHSDMNLLAPLLSQKHSVLQRISHVEQHLRIYKQNWKLFRVKLSRQDRQVLDMALATVEELLSELIAHERDSESILLAKESFFENEPLPARRESAA